MKKEALPGAVAATGGRDVTDAPEAEVVIDMPGSWVPKLTVARDMLDMRCPKGNKKTVYQYSEHEIFAFFGECSRDWDGMVERLTIFADEEHKIISEVRVSVSFAELNTG